MNLPGAREGHLEVTRTARYVLLGGEGEVREFWTACHGYRQLARSFARPFISLADSHRLLVFPEGLSRFYLDDDRLDPGRPRPHGPEDRVGAAWMTREDREHEIRDYVAWLDRLERHLRGELKGGPGPAGTLVVGFSQGGHTAARWVALGRARPHRLVLWGSTLPRDLPPGRLARALGEHGGRVILVRGRGDPSHPESSVERDRAALEEAGLLAEVRTHPGGHTLDQGLLRELAEEGRGG